MRNFFLLNNIPRWVILIIDLIICLFAVIFAYLLRFNFVIPEPELVRFKNVLPIFITLRLISFLVSKTYTGIIRYTSSKDAQRIFVVVSLGSLFIALINPILNWKTGSYLIPFSILIIDYFITTFIMISSRIAVKVLYQEINNPTRLKTNVIIYGAGDSGIISKRALDRDAGSKYKVVAFIDDDKNKIGRKLENVEIFSMDYFDTIEDENDIAHIIISVQNISVLKKQQIVEKAYTKGIKVLNVPPIKNWINGELSFKQIKKIKIEDLLQRDTIVLDTKKINTLLSNTTVLVTGAAGSIGSEMCRQILKFNPKKLILVDQAESALYDIELELIEIGNLKNIEVVIGDIRNKARMHNIFNTFKPNVVFHAAAYKHVPMMENNPSESIITNVLGTKNIADLSVEFNVNEFVMVSTDKAVNPTNIMGASKRIAEIYIQALNQTTKTKFVTTRFGNVLGSNGSVIPRFYKQIEKGGPITITDPEITRYFMTIPEACQLVLEAGAMGQGGEIFIFDMGKSVKIVDLAKRMIQLSGLTLGKDIQIVYTGLRPGEKLYEELLNNSENTVPTHHSQIMIAKVPQYKFEEISTEIDTLVGLFDSQNNFDIVKKMKLIVPEFKSNNSIYEKLD
ncbi:MAG: nucleoside-diphosphate sugar epimerase/dehydratase [Bacteroidota bacterium]